MPEGEFQTPHWNPQHKTPKPSNILCAICQRGPKGSKSNLAHKITMAMNATLGANRDWSHAAPISPSAPAKTQAHEKWEVWLSKIWTKPMYRFINSTQAYLIVWRSPPWLPLFAEPKLINPKWKHTQPSWAKPKGRLSRFTKCIECTS